VGRLEKKKGCPRKADLLRGRKCLTSWEVVTREQGKTWEFSPASKKEGGKGWKGGENLSAINMLEKKLNKYKKDKTGVLQALKKRPEVWNLEEYTLENDRK